MTFYCVILNKVIHARYTVAHSCLLCTFDSTLCQSIPDHQRYSDNPQSTVDRQPSIFRGGCWTEQWLKLVLLWTIVGMPTGSGKSPLFIYLSNLLRLTRPKCGLDATKPGRLVEDARFEKWGPDAWKPWKAFGTVWWTVNIPDPNEPVPGKGACRVTWSSPVSTAL